MKVFGFALISLALLTACSRQEKIETTRLGHDVARAVLTEEQAEKILNAQPAGDVDCVDHVKQVACYSETGQMDPDMSCGAVPAAVLARLPELIDALPPFHKKVFCNISRLQIDPSIYSIGYATFLMKEENGRHVPIGTMIGVRADAISGNTPYDLWSWKEQLNFGLSKPADPQYVLSPAGPRVVATINGTAMPLVVHVFVHEISHLIDFLNSANVEDCVGEGATRPYTIVCKPTPGSFGILSWPESYSFKEDGSDWPAKEIRDMYPWLSQLCYYGCVKTISPSNIGDVYGELARSSFMTPYSSNSGMEDFAEASAFASFAPTGFVYQIVSPDQTVLFDLARDWNAPRLAAKRAWVDAFYAKPDLRYKVEAPAIR